VKKVQPGIQRLFDAKEARRRDLARLPFPEKVRLVVELQKMAAPVYRARGRNVHEWVIE
jgi:hypothetical protein